MAAPVPQKDDVERWTVEQVAAWLQQVELSDSCDAFLRRGIDGHKFLQLSEEDLFLWGRDVSIRNRKQILKLVSQIKNVQQHPNTIKQTPEVQRGIGAQNDAASQHSGAHNSSHVKEDDEYSSDDDFTDEEEEEDDPDHEVEPSQEKETKAWRGTSSLNSSDDHIYLKPIPVDSLSNHPSGPLQVTSAFPQRAPQPPFHPSNFSVTQHSSGVPWNIQPPTRDAPRVGRGSAPAIQCPGQNCGPSVSEWTSGWGPATRPGQQASSRPTIPPKSWPLPTTGIRPSVFPPGSHSAQGSPIENGGGGMNRVLPQHHPRFPGSAAQDATSPAHTRQPRPKEPMPPRIPPTSKPSYQADRFDSVLDASASSYQVDRNDHVYEPVDVPRSHEGPENNYPNGSGWQPTPKPPVPPPRNQNQGDRRGAGGQQGVSSVSLSNRPPAPLPSQVQPQVTPSPPIDRRGRPPNHQWPHGAHSAPANSTHKNQSPSSDCASGVPGKFPDRINLGDNEYIELTPLYRMIMDKPYFHLISRSKAKNLLLNAEEGAFLVRPSTRSSNPLTLSLRHGSRTYNINIRQRPDRLFAMGSEKEQEQKFSSLDAIIETHRAVPIKLQNGETARLTHFPKNSNNFYFQFS